jgi:hypothetical protein
VRQGHLADATAQRCEGPPMRSDLIEHPCIICQRPSRSCGHTKQDRRVFTERTLAARRQRMTQPQPKRAYHRVAQSGPGVFPLDEGHSHVGVPVSGRILRARMSERPAIRSVDDDGYCGQPKGVA